LMKHIVSLNGVMILDQNIEILKHHKTIGDYLLWRPYCYGNPKVQETF
jgi:hypothetical protein